MKDDVRAMNVSSRHSGRLQYQGTCLLRSRSKQKKAEACDIDLNRDTACWRDVQKKFLIFDATPLVLLLRYSFFGVV